MSTKLSPMTLTGAIALREELEQLKRVKRPELIRAIAEARAFGDLKENAEYDAAREAQSMCEARIKEIECKLASAQVIDVAKLPPVDHVIFGATVVLWNDKEAHEVTYQLVGEDEADIKAHRISIAAPLARALIGKFEGDTVTLRAPGGDIVYEILEVRYQDVNSRVS